MKPGVRIWTTYFGGRKFEDGLSLWVDSRRGYLTFCGTTYSDDISTPGAYSTTLQGAADAFVGSLDITNISLGTGVLVVIV